MTRWAVVTVLLYVLLLGALLAGLGFVAFLPDTVTDYKEGGSYWRNLWNWAGDPAVVPLWLSLLLFALAQISLLVVPVRARQGLQIKPRHWIMPMLAAGFLMGLLVAAAGLCVWMVLQADPVFEWAMVQVAAALVFFWVLWFLAFRAFRFSTPDPRRWTARVTRCLLKGSILELVVAVTSHIWVRRRGDCSSPLFTFWAMAAGLAVALAAFGPGVFYLFADRKERMMSRKKREAAAS